MIDIKVPTHKSVGTFLCATLNDKHIIASSIYFMNKVIIFLFCTKKKEIHGIIEDRRGDIYDL